MAALSAAGFDAALDAARALRDESRRVIAALQHRYSEETGIKALKINIMACWDTISTSPPQGDKLMQAAPE